MKEIWANIPDGAQMIDGLDAALLWHYDIVAAVLVFPRIEVHGDVEGFGAVAIEVAACGTPTVAFPIGGVVDAVIDGVNGRLVPEKDYSAFASAVLEMTQMGPTMYRQCRKHAEKFAWARHKERLLEILQPGAEA